MSKYGAIALVTIVVVCELGRTVRSYLFWKNDTVIKINKDKKDSNEK